ncbi:hypothetical protein DERP_014813 [Dermatophagoides pteronyssinus]|uniref:Uncharacterized protein n=1 Tax=Dermatophagoides pteronyssinus TaxID=6956 RepID=A0ABQ8J2L1_DERPT|nr:hypothetical protein DERP_014813 [Dermatophagoides pteronyssinus]
MIIKIKIKVHPETPDPSWKIRDFRAQSRQCSQQWSAVGFGRRQAITFSILVFQRNEEISMMERVWPYVGMSLHCSASERKEECGSCRPCSWFHSLTFAFG